MILRLILIFAVAFIVGWMLQGFFMRRGSEDESPDWMKGMDEDEYAAWAQSWQGRYGGGEE